MRRRDFIWRLAGITGVLAAVPAGQCLAEPNWLNAELIKAALHTATQEEEGFVEYVVGLVKSGKLPPEILQAAYLWAQKQPKYRFQYFKRAVISLARKRGISI